MEGQADDVDVNGTRMSSSFPDVAVHPSASRWWSLEEIESMPGYYKGDSAGGHSTTYDRVRVTSAMGPGELPIYNYNPGIGESTHLGCECFSPEFEFLSRVSRPLTISLFNCLSKPISALRPMDS